MQYLYDLGIKVIDWMQYIAKLFTLPMNSPEFIDFISGKEFTGLETGGGLLAKLIIPLAGNLTLLEFFMTTGLSIYVTITLVKFILPTS